MRVHAAGQHVAAGRVDELPGASPGLAERAIFPSVIMTSARRSPSGVTTVPPRPRRRSLPRPAPRVAPASRRSPAARELAGRRVEVAECPGAEHGHRDDQPFRDFGDPGRVGQRPLPGAQLEDGQVRFPARRDSAHAAPERLTASAGVDVVARITSARSIPRAAASTAWSPGQRRARRRCARAGRWRWCPAGIPGRWRCGRPGRRSSGAVTHVEQDAALAGPPGPRQAPAAGIENAALVAVKQ